jgi:hypothetical protein
MQQRWIAVGAYEQAIRDGVLIPATHCERCGNISSQRLDGHHHNGYEDEHALDVQWLCKACHKSVHPSLETVSQEVRKTIAHKAQTAWMEQSTPQQRSEIGKRVAETRKRNGKANVLTTEQRSENARRGWEKRRQNVASQD